MATNRKRGRNPRDSDPDGVIANRVIQDIIQNASAEFRDYLQRSGTLSGQGQPQPQPMAGGGGMPPAVQGPPAPRDPRYFERPINDATSFPHSGYEIPAPWGGMPMPQPPMPQVPVAPMPGGPIRFEDGSSRQPWQDLFPDRPRIIPGQLSMPDLLRLLGMA